MWLVLNIFGPKRSLGHSHSHDCEYIYGHSRNIPIDYDGQDYSSNINHHQKWVEKMRKENWKTIVSTYIAVWKNTSHVPVVR